MSTSTRAIRIILSIGCLVTVGACTGAKSASGECSSYSCDEDGAKELLWATVDGAYTPSERAKKAFDATITAGVERMKKDQGFTPESFELARGNLKKFLDEIPEGGEDPLGPAAEELQNGTSKHCPLWPFC